MTKKQERSLRSDAAAILGATKSERKAEASRENGKRPKRPWQPGDAPRGRPRIKK